jgi:hypothetical protein
VLCVAALVAAWILGAKVPFSQQWPLYEALRTTAAIIFAVIGAWMAIIYPERIKFSLRGGTKPPVESSGRLSALFAPIVHSTLILGAVLLLGVAAPLVRPFQYVRDHVDLFRSISYFALVFLTLWQLLTVILTLIPADMVKSGIDASEAHAKAVDKHLGRTQVRQRPSSPAP